MTKIKVITYNIWHGHRLDGALEFIRKERPDVLFLQEVSTDGACFRKILGTNLVKKFEEAANAKSFYYKMYEFLEPKYDFGIAILSKMPMRNQNFYYYLGNGLEKYKNMEALNGNTCSRPIISCTIKIEKRKINFLCTHFVWTPNASVSENQIKAAKKLSKYLSRFDNCIIGGDFNTPYGSEVYKILVRGLNEASSVEIPTLHPTHKAAPKKLHIDYLWYKGNEIKKIGSKVPLVDGSDHLPIVAEFEIG